MTIDRQELAKRLRLARDNRGLSQQQAADELGISRPLIAQIELGNRQVSQDELGKFATLYATSVLDLTGTELSGLDEVEASVFEFAPDLLLHEPTKAKLPEVLSLIALAVSLKQQLLHASSRSIRYRLAPPSAPADAIQQGEYGAAEERRRLGLAALPIGDLADLLSSQGISYATTTLPDTVAACVVRHPQVETAVLVNSAYGLAERRFVALTGYAHAVFERGRTVIRVVKRENADELIAKRAAAFAAALLLPASGVAETVARLGKGHPSRKAHSVFDVTSGRPNRAENRAQPGSQLMTYQDVVALAKRFGADYETTSYRLLTLGVLSDSDVARLLDPRQREAAAQLLTVMSPRSDDHPTDGSHYRFELLRLALESYRRQLIPKARLMAIGERLRLPELPKATLLRLAEAVR